MSKLLSYCCEFRNGIHARPASFLAEFCQRFEDDIKIKKIDSYEFNNAKSAISIVSSNILYSDKFIININGDDELETSKEIENYIKGEWLLCDEDHPIEKNDSVSGYIPEVFEKNNQNYLSGVGVVQGVNVGDLDVLKVISLDDNYFENVEKGSIKEESNKFDFAREQSVSSLKSKLLVADDNERDLIKFQIQFVGDEELKVKIYCHIYNGYSAIESIDKVVKYYVETFRSSDSKYIRQRDVDVLDIGYALMSYIDEDIMQLVKPVVESECILLCDTLTPRQFLSLDRKKIKGLIIGNIGETSHTIILAKAFGIPTLINLDISELKSYIGTRVVIDTFLGVCVFNLADRVEQYYDSEFKTYQKVDDLNSRFINELTYTKDGQRVEIAANIINAEECEYAFNSGAEAVGLFRTEMMYIDSDICPEKSEIQSQMNDVLTHVKGRNIIIRTLDIGGDKPAKYIHFEHESNPFLGYRGVRIYKDNFQIFKDLIESIITNDSECKIKIMVPMISSLEEVIWFKENVDKIKQDIGIDKKIEIGIMIEVPSIAFNLEACCEYLDFFSIGTNDLMQYFMAADRENEKVREIYNKYNPSFIRFLSKIINTAKENDKWIGVCGELASDQNFSKLLVGLGVNELSMGCSSISKSKRYVSSLNYEKCKLLVDKALKINTSAELERIVCETSCSENKHNIISVENIKTDVSFIDKDDAIKYMVDNLFVNDLTKNKYALEEDIWNREKTYTTDIGFGFSIPHTKSKNIEKTTISICKLADPVEWGEQKVDMIIMLTIRDENSSGNEHMKIFSLLARKIMNAEFRQNLSACNSSLEIENLMKAQLELS